MLSILDLHATLGEVPLKRPQAREVPRVRDAGHELCPDAGRRRVGEDVVQLAGGAAGGAEGGHTWARPVQCTPKVASSSASSDQSMSAQSPPGEVGSSFSQQQCSGVRAAWFAQVEQQGQWDPLVQEPDGELRQHGQVQCRAEGPVVRLVHGVLTCRCAGSAGWTRRQDQATRRR